MPVRRSRPASATRASTRTSQSPDIYQYNLTLERELPGDLGLRVSYIGSTMRKLLVDRDYNTLPANTDLWEFDNPEDQARLPFPLYGFYMDIVENRGEGQLHAAPARADAALEERLRHQRRLHPGALGQQRARHRQQQPSAP